MWPRRYESIGVNDGKPSSQRPTQSLSLRLRNNKRCAASCISAANWACARPMRTNAAIHTNQLSSQTASTMMPIVCAQNARRRARCASSGCGGAARGTRESGAPLAVIRSVGVNSPSRARDREASSRSRLRILHSRSTDARTERNADVSRREATRSSGRSARSLIASLLLRSQPPRMRGARARAVVRAVRRRRGHRRGWRSAAWSSAASCTPSDGMYELAGRVGGRRRAQDWSLDPAARRRGAATWRLAVVTTGPPRRERARRAARRDATAAHGGAPRGRVDPARQPAARVGAGGRRGTSPTRSARGGPREPDDDPARWPPTLFDAPVGPGAPSARRRGSIVRPRASSDDRNALADASSRARPRSRTSAPTRCCRPLGPGAAERATRCGPPIAPTKPRSRSARERGSAALS